MMTNRCRPDFWKMYNVVLFDANNFGHVNVRAGLYVLIIYAAITVLSYFNELAR